MTAQTRPPAGRPAGAPRSGPGTAAAPPRQKRMTLASIRKTLNRGPEKVFLYGLEGVGKSTFAAAAPNPIFIPAEDGIRNLNPVPPSFPMPESFQDVLDAVAELEAGGHEFETLVIDTIDAIDGLIRDQVCRRNNWSSEDFDAFGRGLKVTPDEHRRLIAALDRLVAVRGMNVIVLGHSRTKNFKNPVGADYLRYEPNLGGDTAPALWKYWAEAVFFATHEAFVQVARGGNEDPALKKGKGVSTGRRVIYTEWNAAYDAKNRYGLPAELPLDYAAYAEARAAGQGAQAAELTAEIQRLVEELQPSDEARAAIGARLLGAQGDGAKLALLANRLREELSKKCGAELAPESTEAQ